MSLKKGNITISGLGSEGYSPSANVSQSGDTTTITITDKTGTTTANIDLSNKQNIIQYSTMPTASASNEGKIVQYTGTTDSTYTNGYFYECVSDGAVSPTYSWETINVQAGGNSDDDGVFYYDGTVNDTNKAMFQKILDRLNAGKGVALYLKNTSGTVWYPCGLEKYNGNGTIYAYPYYVKSDRIYSTPSSLQVAYFSGTTITSINSYNPASIVAEVKIVRDYDSSASSGRTALATNNTKSFTPTAGSYQPATAKYVDDKPTTYAGYDATKTQVLKNINGTLTWVDE